MPKALEKRIQQARILTIQKLETTIQHKMVFKYFERHQVSEYIQRWGVVSKDGLIKVTFKNSESARSFVQNFNFRQRILLRRFNIYFNIQAQESEKQNYIIVGVKQQNQRRIYQITSKFGLVKLNTNYNYGGKLSNQALVCILRSKELTNMEQKTLTRQLAQINVQVKPKINNKKEQSQQNKRFIQCQQKIQQIYESQLKILKTFKDNIIREIHDWENQIHDKFNNLLLKLTTGFVEEIAISLYKRNNSIDNQMQKIHPEIMDQKMFLELQNSMEKSKQLYQQFFRDQLKPSSQLIQAQIQEVKKYVTSIFNKQFDCFKVKKYQKQDDKQRNKLKQQNKIYFKKQNQDELIIKEDQQNLIKQRAKKQLQQFQYLSQDSQDDDYNRLQYEQKKQKLDLDVRDQDW